MKYFLGLCVLTLVSSFAKAADIDLLSSFCSSGTRLSIEDLNGFAKQAFGVEGKKRVSCGLSGEDYKICKSCAEAITPEQMDVLLPMLNKPEHRQWHTTWHNLQLVTFKSPEESKQAISEYVKSGWLRDEAQANEVACSPVSPQKATSHGGESFFLMHREMLKMAQVHLVAKGQSCFKGWPQIPDKVDNTIAPVSNKPSSLEIRNIRLRLIKDTAEKPLSSKEALKKMSLDELGCKLQNAMHSNLHLLWSADENPCKDETNKDQIKCNHLLPADSSPLNPHFWMIHGYIDSYVGKWLKANNYKEISENCQGRPRCYQWRSNWVGKRPSVM